MANLLTDAFTGSDGSAWNASNWGTSGNVVDLNSNRGRMVTTTGSYDFCTAAVTASLLSGTGGDMAIYAEYEVTNATNNNFARIFARDGGSGNRMHLELDLQNDMVRLYTETGYGGPTIASAPFAFATNDIVKIQWNMLGSTHQIHLWVSGSQPLFPTLAATESTWQTQYEVTLFTGTANDGVAITGYWDNVSIDDDPVLSDYSSSTEVGTSLGSNNAQTLPVGSTSGDLIIGFVGNDNPSTTNITASTGWDVLDHQVQGSNVIKGAVIARVLDGGGNDSLSVTGAGQDYVVSLVRIAAGEHGVTTTTTDIKIASAVSSVNSSQFNPPSLNAGSSKDWLWLAGAVGDASTGHVLTAAPSGYQPISLRTSASSTTSVMVGVAYQAIAASTTEDPAHFTSNASQEWIAFTVAVPPAGGASPTTVTAQVADLDLVAVAGVVTPAALTVTAQVATVALSAVAGTITPAALTVTAQVATINLSAIAGTVTPDPATVTAQVATITLSGVPGVATGGDVTVVAQVATVVVSGVAGTVTPGARTVTAQVAEIDLQAVAGVVVPDALTVVAQVATLALEARPGTVTPAAFAVAAQVATITLQALAGVITSEGGEGPTITGRLTLSFLDPDRTARFIDPARTARFTDPERTLEVIQ